MVIVGFNSYSKYNAIQSSKQFKFDSWNIFATDCDEMVQFEQMIQYRLMMMKMN